MDDLDYSVHIAERDWSSFYQECEECDLLQAAVAGMDDSGLSDIEEVEGSPLNRPSPSGLGIDALEPYQSSQEHQQAPTMEHHANASGLQAAIDIIYGNEQDVDLEAGSVLHERHNSSVVIYKSTKGSLSPEPDSFNLAKGIGPRKHSVVLECSHYDVLSPPTKYQAYRDGGDVNKEIIKLNSTSSSIVQEKVSEEKKWDSEKARESASNEADNTSDCGGITDQITESFIPARKWSVEVLTDNTTLNKEEEFHNNSLKGEKPFVLPGLSSNPCDHVNNSCQSHQLSVLMVPTQAEEEDVSEQMSNRIRAEFCKTGNEAPKKEKERWFVTMDIDLTRSRENSGLTVKKKTRKKKSCELSLDCKDWGLAIQSTSETERFRVAECQTLEKTMEGQLFPTGEESTDYTDDTRHQRNSISVHQQSENSYTFIEFLSKDSNIKEPIDSTGLFPFETHQQFEEAPTTKVFEHKGHNQQKQESGLMLQKPEPCRKQSDSCQFSFWEQGHAHDTVKDIPIDYELSLKQCDYQESTESGALDIIETERKESNENLNLFIQLHENISGYAMCKEEHVPFDKIQQELLLCTEMLSSTEKSALQLPIANPNAKYEGLHSAAMYKTIGNIPLDQNIDSGVFRPDYEFPTNKNKAVFLKINGVTANAMSNEDSALSADGNAKSLTAVNKNVLVEGSEPCSDSNLLQATSVQSMLEDPYIDPLLPSIIDVNEISEVKLISSNMTTGTYSSTDPERQQASHTEYEQLMRTEDLTQSSSVHDKLSELPQFPSPDLVGIRTEEIQNKVVSGEHTVHITGPNLGSPFELSSSCNTENEISLPLQSKSESGSESVTLDPVHPVYAISSFWDEMEKLTINDILHLRLVSHSQPVRGSPCMQDTADISDAADSGYFTYMDDSKPDLSSGELSAFSDFEEDTEAFGLHSLNSTTNPSPEPQDPKGKSKCFPDISNSSALLKECELHLITGNDYESGESLNVPVPHSQLSDNVCCPRLMSNHSSGQNFKAQEESHDSNRTPFQPVIANEEEIRLSYLSCHKPKLNLNSEPKEVMHMDRNAEWSLDTSAPFLYRDVLPKSYTISFPEAYEHVFNDDIPTITLMRTCCPVASFDDVNSHNLSVPEMYDYFLYDYERGSFSFSPIQRCKKDKMVPIFSSSHSRRQSLQIPEVYDYINPHDLPIPSDDEEECKPIQVVTRFESRFREPLDTMADSYEYFCTDSDWRGNLFWRNPFSIRGLHFKWRGLSQLGGYCDSWRSTVMNPRGQSFFRTKSPATPRNLPVKEGFPLTLNQSDMCLVCIAFASWVLRSTTPQNSDTWKTVLLANISAISAIRYLRRYIGDGSPGDKP